MRHSLVAVLLATAGVVHAETTPPQGAPFCAEKDKPQEYVIAALKHDQQWIDSLSDCVMSRGGLKLDVIEYGNPVPGTHVDKVGIFGKGGSVVGHTMTIDK